jgi:hypothetical protein
LEAQATQNGSKRCGILISRGARQFVIPRTGWRRYVELGSLRGTGWRCRCNRPAASGRFRHDLYFRLAAITLAIPPFGQRIGEIAGLARAYIADTCTQD